MKSLLVPSREDSKVHHDYHWLAAPEMAKRALGMQWSVRLLPGFFEGGQSVLQRVFPKKTEQGVGETLRPATLL